MRTFAVFIYEGVEAIDVGATYGTLSIARRIIPEIGAFLVADRAEPVCMAGSARLIPDHTFETAPAADVTIVPGGPGWAEQCSNDRVKTFLNRAIQRGLLVSVCTGGMILASSGVLDGRTATTRRRGVVGEVVPLEVMGKKYREVNAIDALFVDCGPVVTGGGITLAIDTTLHVLERLYGRERMSMVARLLEYDIALTANRAAFAAAGTLTG
jgi:transcriptional regulator GlxA family with amidase domain